MTVLSGLHPLAVAAVGGVDCDLLALIDEKRNHHLGTFNIISRKEKGQCLFFGTA